MAGNPTQRLIFYDENYQAFDENPLRSFHNGYLGDSHEQICYLRNRDPSVYYSNIKIKPEMIGGYKDIGEFGLTGWGIKLMYGKRRPTEAEWDLVRSGDAISIPDIGTTEAADTFTNHPVWIRIYCPGNEDAQIRENMQLKVTYFVKKVGA
mgnify:FL=1